MRVIATLAFAATLLAGPVAAEVDVDLGVLDQLPAGKPAPKPAKPPAAKAPAAKPPATTPTRTARPDRVAPAPPAPVIREAAPAPASTPDRAPAAAAAPTPAPEAPEIREAAPAPSPAVVASPPPAPAPPPAVIDLPPPPPPQAAALERGAAQHPDAVPERATLEEKVSPAPPPPAPPKRPGEPVAVLPFATGAAELSEEAKAILRRIAERLAADERLQVELLAYAEAEDASLARRLALARAIAARSFLVEQGIRAQRVELRPLGAPSDAAGDRIDLRLARR